VTVFHRRHLKGFVLNGTNTQLSREFNPL
jgi:hypothetical protein